MSTPSSAILATRAGFTPVGPGYGRDIRVMLIGPGEYMISWQRPDTEISPAHVQRSEFINGPFEDVAVTSGTTATDTPSDVRKIYTVWYYRIVYQGVTIGPESLDDETDVLDPGDCAALNAAWMLRRHMARVGQPAHLIAPPTEGRRCTECWDSVREVQIRSSCRTCDGTGYLTGSAEPILMYVSFGKEEPVPQATTTSKIVAVQTSAYTSNYPLLKPGDFLVRDYDRRVFEILQWQPTRLRSFIIRQNIIARLCEKGSPPDKFASLV